MRTCTNTLLMVVLLGLVTLWVGCGALPTMGNRAMKTASIEVVDIPPWGPPEVPYEELYPDRDYLYATETASGTDLGFALDAAQEAGRVDIASQIQVKVSGLFKRFREEVGAGEDAELASVTTIVSKQVVSEVLSGARRIKQDVKKEDNLYRVYVMMGLHIGEIKTALLDKTKADENLYARFRASQAFEELEAEVEKYEQWKKEQEQKQRRSAN